MSAQLLEVSLSEVGTVLRLERDARSMVKMTKASNKVSTPLSPGLPALFVHIYTTISRNITAVSILKLHVNGP